MSEIVDRKRSRYRALFSTVIGTLAAFGGAATAVGKALDYIQALRQGDPPIEIIPALVLLGATVAYGFAWYISANIEYGLFEKHLDAYAPDRPIEAVVASVAVPGALSLLAFLTNDISFYAAIFVAYTVINAVIRRAMTREARRIVERADGHVDARVLTEFQRLYIQRPFQLINAVLVVGGIAALLLATLPLQPASHVPGIGGRLIAYGCLLATMVCTESIVWLWRSRFYRSVA